MNIVIEYLCEDDEGNTMIVNIEDQSLDKVLEVLQQIKDKYVDK